MVVLTKTVNSTTEMSIEFSQFYRENRHGTRKIKVVINVDFIHKNENDKKCSWEARVKIPREKGQIVWEFEEACPQWIQDEVSCVYNYEHFVQLLSGMTKRRACM